ncbi:LapA family protein [Antarctobacter sp.]|uniref:LapA family protein n=1 Tax=Antarctobacter sp. TaxID=1872577 RepID=UPI002B27B1B2|nr:LapA family protein [Antarctobacter sp.]
MRYVLYAFYAILLIVLTVVCVANLQWVTLNTLPEGLTRLPQMDRLAFSVEVPLFAVALGFLVLGWVLGEVYEWLREYKYRAEASAKKTEVRKLERQLKKTQAERDKDKDEVLAILDQAS